MAGAVVALAGGGTLLLRGPPAPATSVAVVRPASPPESGQVRGDGSSSNSAAPPAMPMALPTSPRMPVAATAVGEVDWTRVCRPPPEALPAPAELHRWRDAEGRRVFSDRPPATAAADHVALALPADATSVAVDALGGDVPPGLASEIGADLRLLVGQLVRLC